MSPAKKSAAKAEPQETIPEEIPAEQLASDGDEVLPGLEEGEPSAS